MGKLDFLLPPKPKAKSCREKQPCGKYGRVLLEGPSTKTSVLCFSRPLGSMLAWYAGIKRKQHNILSDLCPEFHSHPNYSWHFLYIKTETISSFAMMKQVRTHCTLQCHQGYSFQTGWAQWSRWTTTCRTARLLGSGCRCTSLHSSLHPSISASW